MTVSLPGYNATFDTPDDLFRECIDHASCLEAVCAQVFALTPVPVESAN